jgi:hypothetical protein
MNAFAAQTCYATFKFQMGMSNTCCFSNVNTHYDVKSLGPYYL